MRLIRLLLIVLLPAMLVSSQGCQNSDHQEHPGTSDNGATVIQPHGAGQVEVQFESPADLPAATLYRIDADQLTKVKRLNAATDQVESVKLDSGFYMVQLEDSKSKFPVPALSPFLASPTSSLPAIKLEPFPETDQDWCWIPAGPTVIGDTIGVGREDERPAKIVDTEGFYLGSHEVTNENYAAFLSSQTQSQQSIQDNWIDLESRKCRIEKADQRYVSDAPSLPVVMVSLAGARAYCQWLSDQSGVLHRLPTEIEWEKAARGPELFVYSYGNIYHQSAANQESGKLKPVGTYDPNSWGLYDMTGNVFEWMENVADPEKDDTTLNHSLRGGSFMLDGMYLRNSFRMRQSPSVMTDDIGFRVLREMKEEDE